MFDTLSEHLTRAWYRSHFFMNVPMVLQQLKFRDLRSEYYRELWREAASNVGRNSAPGSSDICVSSATV